MVGFPGFEAVEQFIAAQHQRGRQAIAQLLTNDLIDGAGAAGQGNHPRRIDARRSEAGDQGPFAVPEQNQLAEARIGFELAPPGFGVGHIGFD
ncbi:hypothetical protein D3C71_1928870 [compost metagenome]